MKRQAWLCCTFFLLAAALPSCGAVSGSRHSVSFEGTEISYLDEGEKNEPALVFIHGWSCRADFWRFQMSALQTRYRVIALDLPGFGQSGKPRNRAYTMEFFSRAVKAVLDQAGVSRPVLVGHSMGYGVVLKFLAGYPGQARGACSVDGAFFWLPEDPGAVPEWETEMKGMVEGLSGPDRERVVRWFIGCTFYGRTPGGLRREILEAMSSADAYAANSSMAEFIKRENWVPRTFSVPALAVYSKIPELPADTEIELRRTFQDLSYVEWTDTGHYLMMEQPERFNSLLVQFLERLENEDASAEKP